MDYVFSLINHYGIWFAFLLVVIENMGIPFPVEFVYLYFQNMIGAHSISFVEVTAFLTLSHVTGAVISYYIGLAGNSVVAERFKHSKGLIKAQQRTEQWYAKYGSITIFIARLVGYVRPWSSLIAGFGKEKFWKFFGWTVLGSLIFSIGALLFANMVLYFLVTYPIAKYIVGVVFLFFFGGVWFLFPWLGKKFKF